jgi:hypothetical protein
MLSISKVMTLNKRHLLENLCSMLPGGTLPECDYFHFGRPVDDPPLLRGSMLLSLRPPFLTDNAASFHYGSPVDTGGIRFGFLKPPSPETFLAETTCDYATFNGLMAELCALPPSVLTRLAAHRRTNEAGPVLAKYLSAGVAGFMLQQDLPQLWFFEFSLRAGYRLEPAHVEELSVPNTYAAVPLFRRLRAILGNRMRLYNPRFGCLGA